MTKKYLSLERLTEYDELIKTVIDSGDATMLSNAQNYAKDYTDDAIENLELITTDDIDAICNGVTEGALTQTDVDELMAELNPEGVM